CRYGIEYVEDPQSHRRIPTVNRAQYTSIFADADYKSAIQYADGAQRIIYEQEAKAIDDIQKGILEISAKEEPFDIFICYKETDANGRRTQDSVLANDLYHQLTAEGFKVFFSRITLEDKLGIAYEPYIFAALNSAKVMVVLGTKPEYFNAVWVKNEWSRYLALVKNSGGRKMLIPAYRDMDPYDLPEEFSHLQAQDMSKLGFMQDLIRGIQKIISADAPKAVSKETVIVGANSAAVAPLLERVFLFLEDGKWRDADTYCEKVLDIDPKNDDAYLGKLMAELQVKNRKQLADCPLPFDDHDNYHKVIRFGDDKLESELRGYIAHINDRNENARLNGIYNTALNTMRTANTRSECEEAANQFRSISGFQDADALAEQCLTKAEVCRKNSIYTIAKSKMWGKGIRDYEAAIQTFQTISGWRDADEQILACKKAIEVIKMQEESYRLQVQREAEERRAATEKAEKKRKKALAIGIPIVCVCIAFLIVLATVIIPKAKYNKAMGLIDAGDYEPAYALLEEIGNDEAIVSSKYDRAMELIDAGDYEPAYALLEEIGNDEAIACSKYDRAMELIDSGDYEPAYMLLDGLEYKDSHTKLQS
ncbi:MAG: toll/interleukin-1 receptor domain-containing protein, partial [Clostridia bacterium]|nr:toll/interleukin-1 receptor domain-containing protein [Clostridia bacterium]